MKTKTKLYLGIGLAGALLLLWKSKKNKAIKVIPEQKAEDKTVAEKVETAVKDVVNTVKETVKPTTSAAEPVKKVVPNPITEPKKYEQAVKNTTLPPTVQSAIDKIKDPVERETAENATKHIAFQAEIMKDSLPPSPEGMTKISTVDAFGQMSMIDVPTEAITKAIETKTYWGETTTPTIPTLPIANILKPIKAVQPPVYTLPKVKTPLAIYNATPKPKPSIDFEMDRPSDREAWA
jgi:hypothetical protein